MKRQVYIDTLSNNGQLLAHVICYVHRRKYQRYYAAQFDPAIELESVRKWVEGQVELELIDKPKDADRHERG